MTTSPDSVSYPFQPYGVLGPYPWQTVNVQDFGATGDGVTDDGPRFQLALDAIPAEGGILIIPPAVSGRYLIGQCLRHPSYIVIRGSGAAAVLTRAPDFEASTDYGGTSMFLNLHSEADETAFTGYRDFEITFENVWFDNSDSDAEGAAHAIFNRACKGVKIINCHFTGGGDATASVTCDDHLVDGCTAIGQINCCYDHWGGSTNCRVVSSFARVGDNNAAQVINFNGIRTGAGTGGSEVWVSDGFVMANCEVYGNATQRSISLEPLGSNTSKCQNIRLIGNKFYNVRVVMSGNTTNVAIIGNHFLGSTGQSPTIWARTQNALDADLVTVVGNQFKDCVAPTGDGLIDTNATNTSIIGNTEVDCTYDYAVRFRNGVGGAFVGNMMENAAVSQTLGVWGSGQNVQVSNDYRLSMLDTSGVPVYLTVDATNTLFLVGSSAGGGPRALLSAGMTSSTSSLQFFPNITCNGVFREASVETGITAAGSSILDAYVLSKQISIVATAAAGTGVQLFAVTGSGATLQIYNDGANTLTVYPPAGGTINGGASVTVASGASTKLLSTATNVFRTAA